MVFATPVPLLFLQSLPLLKISVSLALVRRRTCMFNKLITNIFSQKTLSTALFVDLTIHPRALKLKHNVTSQAYFLVGVFVVHTHNGNVITADPNAAKNDHLG